MPCIADITSALCRVLPAIAAQQTMPLYCYFLGHDIIVTFVFVDSFVFQGLRFRKWSKYALL